MSHMQPAPAAIIHPCPFSTPNTTSVPPPKKTLQVWFMTSGEMGRSIFNYPVSYLKLMSKYRGSLAESKNAGSVKMGVALHWNKVCGNCFDMPQVNSHSLYNTTYHQVRSRTSAPGAGD